LMCFELDPVDFKAEKRPFLNNKINADRDLGGD
jgi:hypothetical protein